MGMEWFVLVIVGFIVWAYLSNPLNRARIAQFNRKAGRTGKSRSQLMHPRLRG